jgi:hypothetical protein
MSLTSARLFQHWSRNNKLCFTRNNFCTSSNRNDSFIFPEPQPDLDFLLSSHNRSTILENLVKRLEVKPPDAEAQLEELIELRRVIDV